MIARIGTLMSASLASSSMEPRVLTVCAPLTMDASLNPNTPADRDEAFAGALATSLQISVIPLLKYQKLLGSDSADLLISEFTSVAPRACLMFAVTSRLPLLAHQSFRVQPSIMLK